MLPGSKLGDSGQDFLIGSGEQILVDFGLQARPSLYTNGVAGLREDHWLGLPGKASQILLPRHAHKRQLGEQGMPPCMAEGLQNLDLAAEQSA